ncbi:S-layer homology domain-containing protein [Bacillus thermotolerans]|uniref:S-layer homology domain-containing protein n=1 Tax=Bacillus thermotolerans TaxID=1221996 RepID=UPI00057CF94D|nr:S-layer homology domain-containing protein [Bacillus thermotolerans]KKB33472.1 hypothetical protein QY97_03285 [Bacillus thermotolerans]
MKKMKRVLAAAVAGGMLLSSASPASGHAKEIDLPPLYETAKPLPFTDVSEDSRYSDSVEFLYTYKMSNGLTRTKFGVAENLTRVDAMMLLGNYARADAYYAGANQAPFTDVPARAMNMISSLYEARLIAGKTPTKLDSFSTITRGEAAIILARAAASIAGVPRVSGKFPFTDATGRYEKPVHILYQAGIARGKTETRFGVHDPLTRGEFAIMLYNLHQLEIKFHPSDTSRYGELPSSGNGLTMSLEKDVFKATDEKVTVEMTNTSEGTYDLNSSLTLEKKVGDEWVPIRYWGIAFPDTMYSIEPGGTFQNRVPLGYLRYKLGEGEYRVVESFSSDTEGETTLAVPFKVVE